MYILLPTPDYKVYKHNFKFPHWATEEYDCPSLKCFTHGGLSEKVFLTTMKYDFLTHVIGTSCFWSAGSRLSCCADTTLTRAFLQEDDLGLWEEVGPSDGHLFSPTDQTAAQAGFLHLGQLLS